MGLSKSVGIGLLVFTIACLCLAIAIGLSLHYAIPRTIDYVQRTDTVGNCLPETTTPDETNCTARSCQWQPSDDGSPWCIFPPESGYIMEDVPVEDSLGYHFSLKRIGNSKLFQDGIENLKLDIEFHTSQSLRIKIAGGNQFEVPNEALSINTSSTAVAEDERLYNITWTNDAHFGLKVTRKSTGAVVFDTTTPGFVFSPQYIQLTVKLASDIVYGLGEHNHRRLRHDMKWKKWTIFTRDVAPVDEWNLYGAQTFFMNLEQDGNANGVFLLNSNAMDIVLQPAPYPGLTYHVIGGILDFYIFLGPTPENVVQQYTGAVGRPLMPPYWALGFQLSRWGYQNLSHVQEVVRRNREAGIPQDVQYGDIDYMESKLDFTYDKISYDGLPEFVNELHQNGQKYIIILDHGIGCDQKLIDKELNGTYKPLVDGLASNIFVRSSSEQILEGEVWPGISYYPDFSLGDNVTAWWKTQCNDFYNSAQWGVKYDALWIDMNEPSNFVQGSTSGCNKNDFNNPPYLPNILGGLMYDKTICMDAVQHWGKHYDVHSLYGHGMAITTFNTMKELFPQRRPLVLTRSNFAGTQKYAAHWLGDNQSQWPQMAWSIVGMLEYSLFGFSYTGADICGFWYGTTEEMCQRWMQLGAFYPYSRNHNAETWPDQDPAAFGPDMIRSSREVLNTRYKLLPFLYTLLYEAHTFGSTVVRPLVNEFPTDSTAREIDRQFLWGSSLLISPVLEEKVTFVNAYFPSGRWYDYYGGSSFDSPGVYRNLSAPLEKINLHVRGGSIIPWQEPSNTTVFSRQKPMGLIVALSQGPGYEAKGNLFWDDGESFETIENKIYLLVEFTCTLETLTLQVKENVYPANLTIETIELWGLERKITNVMQDGSSVDLSNIIYDGYTKNTRLTQMNLNINGDHTIKWQRES